MSRKTGPGRDPKRAVATAVAIGPSFWHNWLVTPRQPYFLSWLGRYLYSLGGQPMKIADGLYSMSQTKGGRVHAFLIAPPGDEGLILIDTLYNDDASVVLAELSAIGKTPKDIKTIALTHSHKSHLGGLATIATLSGAKVLAHEDEIPIIEGRRKAKPVGFKPPKPFNAEVYALQIGLNLGRGRHTPVSVNDRLKEGMKIGPLELLSVPGHTSGCIAFWWPERRALIAGDTVATWPVLDLGWPTFNLDPAAAKHSVGKMAELSTCDILGVGHGDPILKGGADVLKGLKLA
jgi:glyoxylase-like metal-dependent hydrolase (beta-lactamase superfamily II)